MRARDNPFATDRVLRVRYRLLGTTWEDLLAQLESLNFRAAIVGPEGSGKTTLLEDLEPHLRARGFPVCHWRFDDRKRSTPPVHKSGVVLLDGAEVLRPWEWWWYSRRLPRLVITAHRPGLLPTLWECRTTPALLEEIVAGLHPGAKTEGLFEKHGGNLRVALRELYDRYAEAVI